MGRLGRSVVTDGSGTGRELSAVGSPGRRASCLQTALSLFSCLAHSSRSSSSFSGEASTFWHSGLARSPLCRQASTSPMITVGSRIVGSVVGRLVGSVGRPVGSPVGRVIPVSMFEVEGDRQVRVVAHVQVAGDLGVAADDLVDERVGQEHVERVDEVVAGCGDLGQHRVELLQRVDRGGLGRLDHADADVAEVGERLEHLDQVVALLVDRDQRRRQLLEGGVDRVALLVDRDRQVVELVDGVDDVGLVVVELRHQQPDLVEHGPGRALAALQRDVQLAGDRAQLGDPATVEQQAEGAEHLLDLGVAAAALQGDHVAAGQRFGARAALGSGERHELLAQQAGLPDRRHRVVGELGAAAQLDRDVGGEAVEPDVGHLAHADVVHLHRRLRHQVQHVAEHDVDGDGVVADVGAAGQGQLVDVEPAAGDRQRADEGQEQQLERRRA